MIKAIIFDCFGVLYEDPLSVMLTELDQEDSERANKAIEIINHTTVSRIGAVRSRTQIASLFKMSPEEYTDKLRAGQVKNVKLLEYIEQLRSNYRIGMLSNVAKDGLSGLFTEDELSKCFDTIIISGSIGYAKPYARAYEIMAERLGVTLDECLMIDDREDYCAAARNVGMKSITYISFAQMRQELTRLLKT